MDVEPLVLDVNSDLGADVPGSACSWPGGTPTPAATRSCDKVADDPRRRRSWRRCTTTTTSPGRKSTAARSSWVVRKGATPAFPGQQGFVGGSMGDDSVILEGVERTDERRSRRSILDGARRRPRDEPQRPRPAGKSTAGPEPSISPGLGLPRDDAWSGSQERGVELRGAGTDEVPHCYKRLPEVLGHHGGTVRVLHTLTPIGVAMAGADEFDPYKD